MSCEDSIVCIHAHLSDEERIKVCLEFVRKIKSFGYDVIVTSHSQATKEFQDEVDYFVYDKTKEIIDDHFFINRIIGIPMLDIVEYDYQTKSKFNQHWHTHNDNMNIISKKTLQAVGVTLINIIYNEK